VTEIPIACIVSDKIEDLIARTKKAVDEGATRVTFTWKGSQFSGTPDDVLADLMICQAEAITKSANAMTAVLNVLTAQASEFRARTKDGSIRWEDRFEAQELLDRMNRQKAMSDQERRRVNDMQDRMSKMMAEMTSRTVSSVDEVQTGAIRIAALTDRNGVRQLRLQDVIAKAAPGMPVAKVLEDMIEKSYSQLARMFYPRQYENVGQYHSPKQCAYYLTTVVAETLRLGFDKAPTAYRLMMPGLKGMMDKRMPMFFISPELLKAVQLTDFSGDIDWTTMKLPYEHGIFILPKGGYRHESDGEVSMIMWSRTEGGSEYLPPVMGIPKITVQNTAMATIALCPEAGIWYDACLSAEMRKTLQLRNLFYRGPGESAPSITKNVIGLDEDLTEKDSAFLDGIGVICFGTLMAMIARPELLEPAKMLRRIAAKGSAPREFWSPNIVGMRYRMRHEVPQIRGDQFVFTKHEGGTHASPRMHWRRGHMRQQPYGVQRRERKTIWIEPCLIGADL
jgi:hypothetical protein